MRSGRVLTLCNHTQAGLSSRQATSLPCHRHAVIFRDEVVDDWKKDLPPLIFFVSMYQTKGFQSKIGVTHRKFAITLN